MQGTSELLGSRAVLRQVEGLVKNGRLNSLSLLGPLGVLGSLSAVLILGLDLLDGLSDA